MGAAEVGPSKLRLRQIGIYTHNYSFFKGSHSARQESLEQINTQQLVFSSTLREKKLHPMTVDVIWNSVFEIHLDSMGANNPPMGLAFDRRGNQVGGGDVRGAVLNTTEQGARGRGGGRTRPLIYLFAPLLFQALEKKAKKSARGRERLSWVNYQVQREELAGGYDHEMNCRAALGRRARGGKKCLWVKRPLILGYKNRQSYGWRQAMCHAFQRIKPFIPTVFNCQKNNALADVK